jgi:hypothetical protein
MTARKAKAKARARVRLGVKRVGRDTLAERFRLVC